MDPHGKVQNPVEILSWFMAAVGTSLKYLGEYCDLGKINWARRGSMLLCYIGCGDHLASKTCLSNYSASLEIVVVLRRIA